MKRILAISILLAAAVPAGSTEGIIMWGCAPGGERRNVLYLADRGSQSYVKMGSQRIPANLTRSESEQRWTFGSNYISLSADQVATYHERGAVKAKFRCRKLE